VQARGRQRLAVGWLSDCGGAVVGCEVAARGDRRLDGAVPPGAAILAVGHVGATSGTFVVRTSSAALGRCLADVDCPLGQACDAETCRAAGAAPFAPAAPVEVPDLGVVEVPLELPPGPGGFARVRVRVRLDHPFPSDLVARLISPGGMEVRLRDRRGGGLDTVYGEDRAADGPGRLLDLALGPRAGRWRFVLEDVAPGDRGRLLGAHVYWE
jgi:hypothetical protein